MFFAILFFIIGLAVLIVGADFLVRGAASLAKRIGISSLVIGLTVVAFGTSMPELTVNIFSALRGSADIAIGNVIGSNIFNILVILGLATLFYPLAVKSSTIWKEIPFALLAMVLVYTMGNDRLFDKTGFNAITRTDGFSLLAMFAVFMFYIFSLAKEKGSQDKKVKIYSWPFSIFFTLGGISALFIGGKILVDNAIVIARVAGLSESLIGLTIVAVGTSLPELATSVVAAYHRYDDIAIGNIVGSNIFNVFLILGLTSTFLQLPFNPAINFDVLVGIAATLLLFLFMFVHHRHKLNRWQGIAFLVFYLIYLAFLIYRG